MNRSQKPPLTLLQTFEIVARCRSFTRAADELCLTQSAVSRQIQVLEENLGLHLFQRRHRAIALTPEGQKLFDAVGRGLREIDTCLRSIRAETRQPQITISASVAFAHFWLMPRLMQFRTLHPDVDLNVLASDRPSVPKVGEVDVAVLFGNGQWPGINAQLLFEERVYPVCSPAYQRAHSDFSGVHKLLEHTLLHLDYGGTTWGSADWPAWLTSQGVMGQPRGRGIRFNSYPLLLQAAEAGQGVALGWSYITDPMVAEGKLTRPVGEEMHTQDGYYLSAFEGVAQRPEVMALIEWLRSEAAVAAGSRMSAGNAKHSG